MESFTGVVESDIDCFAADELRDPFSSYRVIRDQAPVVKLSKLDVYAVARYADVAKALRTPDVLVSGKGVGFSDVFNAVKGNNVLQSDAAQHRKLRAAIMPPMTPSRVREIRPVMKSLITKRVRELDGIGTFDAMRDLADCLPIEFISRLIGLPTNSRQRMLAWGAAAFNLIGPYHDNSDLSDFAEAKDFMAGLTADDVIPGSWAAELFAVAGEGKISNADARAAVSAYVLPSLETTIMAIGHLLYNLAQAPDQWAMLQKKPEFIPAAVHESMRHSTVIRWFSRHAAQDYPVDGLTIPAGARVMLMYASANRDDRHYAMADCFDIRRDARDHLGWGAGPHMCAGLHVARIEMEVLLEALIEQDVRLRAGAPVVDENRGLYGFAKLPFQIDSSGN